MQEDDLDPEADRPPHAWMTEHGFSGLMTSSLPCLTMDRYQPHVPLEWVWICLPVIICVIKRLGENSIHVLRLGYVREKYLELVRPCCVDRDIAEREEAFKRRLTAGGILNPIVAYFENVLADQPLFSVHLFGGNHVVNYPSLTRPDGLGLREGLVSGLRLYPSRLSDGGRVASVRVHCP